MSCWLQKIYTALCICLWKNARSMAYGNGKAKGLFISRLHTEDKYFSLRASCREASFQCSVWLWKQHRMCTFCFQDTTKYVSVELYWSIYPHQPSHTRLRRIYNGKNKKGPEIPRHVSNFQQGDPLGEFENPSVSTNRRKGFSSLVSFLLSGSCRQAFSNLVLFCALITSYYFYY